MDSIRWNKNSTLDKVKQEKWIEKKILFDTNLVWLRIRFYFRISLWLEETAWVQYSKITMEKVIDNICLFLFKVTSYSIKPMIEPEPDLTVLPGENIRLKCKTTVPVHWRFQVIFYFYFVIKLKEIQCFNMYFICSKNWTKNYNITNHTHLDKPSIKSWDLCT